jgi:murein DD-endopeptidase MepM/ murein hydrolase activator NlpD
VRALTVAHGGNVAKVVKVRSRPILAAALLLACLPALGSAPAGAATVRQRQAGVDASIQQVNGQLDQVDSQEVQIQLQIDHARAAQAALDAQVGAHNARIVEVEGRLATAQASLNRASAALVDTELRLSATREQQGQARERLKNDAVTAYMEQPGPEAASAILDLQSIDEVQRQMSYLQAVAATDARDLARLEQLTARTGALEDAQQAAQRQALDQRDAVASDEADLARARQALVEASAAQAQSADSLAGLQAQLDAEKARLQAELAALQAQSNSIAALIRQEEAVQSGAVFTGGQLAEPIPGAPITSPYGWRVDPILHTRSLHTGIDFGAPYGTPIHAAADGVVVAAGPEGGYGNATIVEHGGGIATLYGHQEQILVSAGDHVSRGQVIGLVGCTGWCTGPHVHFEVRVDGTPVDPAPYLGLS